MGPVGKALSAALLLGIAGGGAFWWLTSPDRLDADDLAALGTGDPARGELIFNAGGCTSCHARPKSEGAARLELAGGVELVTPFGTFVAPNISQDPRDGIGLWSLQEFADAMLHGVSPEGEHYYPAFPYTSYARMAPGDVADLYAYMKTLPAIAGAASGHRLGFPFNIRRGLGLWKRLH
ncbi:MAG TPA: cytochrome c, partial [Rhizobiales bacterium]|nr:cytochrome c [Hyphomicrobiales bacterium]